MVMMLMASLLIHDELVNPEVAAATLKMQEHPE
jgi:hypothetical protein